VNPYTKISEDVHTITYEYNPWHTWLLIVLSLVFLIFWYSGKLELIISSASILLIYYVSMYLAARTISNEIRAAIATQHAETEGKKYSFANPLRIRILKYA
jgi:ABC-type nickel/cobalt efflux system permease component RcnA